MQENCQLTDFVRPIIFMFSSGIEVLNAEVLKTEPDNLGAKLEIRKDSNSIGIELQPLLMNSGDSIDISTVVASFDENLTVDGRIIDVKMIKLEKETETNDDKSFIFLRYFIYGILLGMLLIAGSILVAFVIWILS